MRADRGWKRAVALVLSIAASGCAARSFTPPDPAAAVGEASAAAKQQWAGVVERCGAQKTLNAEAGLSGRVGGSRVRGKVHLGLASSGGVRIEAIAPFGAPIFVLAGTDRSATLVLPRDGRTYDGQPADIIDALAGVRLTAVELLAVVNGCLGADREPTHVAAYRDGVIGVDVGGTDIWLRTDGAITRVVGLRRGDLLVDYPDQISGFPLDVRLRRTRSEGDSVDLRLKLAQVERNGDIADAAFRVDGPAGAQPITLDELRRTGLLGGR